MLYPEWYHTWKKGREGGEEKKRRNQSCLVKTDTLPEIRQIFLKGLKMLYVSADDRSESLFISSVTLAN